MSKSRLISLSLIILTAIIGLYYIMSAEPKIKTAGENAKALIGGPFHLVDHHGKEVSDQDFRGKYMLIYFGYSYCPDICPMELETMADAMDHLPKKTLEKIVPLFITVDPERDTVDILAQYVPAFHPRLIGLTGTKAQITAVKKAYRIYAAKEKLEEGMTQDSYLMNDTSYIYLMDKNGEYITHFKPQTDPLDMARRLKELVR